MESTSDRACFCVILQTENFGIAITIELTTFHQNAMGILIDTNIKRTKPFTMHKNNDKSMRCPGYLINLDRVNTWRKLR